MRRSSPRSRLGMSIEQNASALQHTKYPHRLSAPRVVIVRLVMEVSRVPRLRNERTDLNTGNALSGEINFSSSTIICDCGGLRTCVQRGSDVNE